MVAGWIFRQHVGGMESSALMILSSASVAAPDASKMPARQGVQAGGAGRNHSHACWQFFLQRSQLTPFFNTGFFDSAGSFCLCLTRKALLNFLQKNTSSRVQMSVFSLHTEGRKMLTQNPFCFVFSLSMFDFTICKENFVFASIAWGHARVQKNPKHFLFVFWQRTGSNSWLECWKQWSKESTALWYPPLPLMAASNFMCDTSLSQSRAVRVPPLTLNKRTKCNLGYFSTESY